MGHAAAVSFASGPACGMLCQATMLHDVPVICGVSAVVCAASASSANASSGFRCIPRIQQLHLEVKCFGSVSAVTERLWKLAICCMKVACSLSRAGLKLLALVGTCTRYCCVAVLHIIILRTVFGRCNVCVMFVKQASSTTVHILAGSFKLVMVSHNTSHT